MNTNKTESSLPPDFKLEGYDLRMPTDFTDKIDSVLYQIRWLKKKKMETKFLYSMIVAGKSAKFANEVVSKWKKENVPHFETTLAAIRRLEMFGKLYQSFVDAKTGNYTKLHKACQDWIKLNPDLATCTPEQLEEIHGVGPKTSRFFIIWTRPDANYAALDVHILKWMKNLGYDVPKSTPQNKKKYATIEQLFLKEAADRGKTPRELDLEIWSAASTEGNVA